VVIHIADTIKELEALGQQRADTIRMLKEYLLGLRTSDEVVMQLTDLYSDEISAEINSDDVLKK
jgi:hypothetical protein